MRQTTISRLARIERALADYRPEPPISAEELQARREAIAEARRVVEEQRRRNGMQ